MMQSLPIPMTAEQRQERFTAYAHMLRERFRSGILAELQPLNQWVVWRAELEDSKRKKVPYNPNYSFLARASVKIPKSWGTLEQALHALATGNYSGIGFMITSPLVMIDLDNSYERKNGAITDPRAAAIIQQINSYTEASPTNGLHLLTYGQLPGRGLHTNAVEIYGQDRFTTITTDHIVGTPIAIEYRQEEVNRLYQQFVPLPVEQKENQNTGLGVGSGNALTELPPESANDPLLQQLLRGDIIGFQSPSNADFVLVLKLLHWTGDNVELTRRLFLESGLYREKTERKTGATTYLEKTIQNALKKRRNPPQRR